jgi:outer membrane translocation and assembly module TamA
LKKSILEVKIDDEEKYRWKLRFFLNTVTSSGAAIFKALEEENILKQGWSITTKGAYYRLNSE